MDPPSPPKPVQKMCRADRAAVGRRQRVTHSCCSSHGPWASVSRFSSVEIKFVFRQLSFLTKAICATAVCALGGVPACLTSVCVKEYACTFCRRNRAATPPRTASAVRREQRCAAPRSAEAVSPRCCASIPIVAAAPRHTLCLVRCAYSPASTAMQAAESEVGRRSKTGQTCVSRARCARLPHGAAQ